jgi:DNA-binding response OmpR family regulator
VSKFLVRILVVDDEEDTCTLIADILEEDGFHVDRCLGGEQAMKALQQEQYALVLSDIKMPRISGMDLLRYVQRRDLDTMVILMTAYATIETAVQALRGEAFDYLLKPFDPLEVRKRVHAAIQARASGRQRHDVEHCDGLTIDHSARRAWVGEHEVSLTRLEFDVLAYLFDRLRCVVSVEDLLLDVWECSQGDGRSIETVRSVVRRLRQQLGDDARAPRFIFNVRGIGYQLGQSPDNIWGEMFEDSASA